MSSQYLDIILRNGSTIKTETGETLFGSPDGSPTSIPVTWTINSTATGESPTIAEVSGQATRIGSMVYWDFDIFDIPPVKVCEECFPKALIGGAKFESAKQFEQSYQEALAQYNAKYPWLEQQHKGGQLSTKDTPSTIPPKFLPKPSNPRWFFRNYFVPVAPTDTTEGQMLRVTLSGFRMFSIDNFASHGTKPFGSIAIPCVTFITR
ncbi:hypothetical protein SAMD00019534_007740 [Acytostelium subglobosum LB1]|uniref:hypothetical protein n=1 Tax=Acytostelium subglobosum LB1 TaxID=1410327 RepID=UPI000644BC96|nr:hypothetical protein SAMD00019534_007740 [Acytostelium subglobosum LB1]GAM17599.1 hypothetical protein SAMD00019534_007740 [Acytostelium subglobosum LB1]|eukprot:XP_012758195.1 hypothetical protein SAMD00019534_007740 [Acytostelium subglobosum LB1]